MSYGTKIEWTQWSWTCVRGCSRKSPGCENCYAERMARRFDKPGRWAEGLTVIRQGRPGWSGKIKLVPEKLHEPLAKRVPHRIFVCSTSDLFHEDVPFEFIAAVWGVMAAARQHTFQVLTKRPERMREFLAWLVDPKQGSRGYVWQSLYSYAREAGVSERRLGGKMDSPWPWPLPNVWLGVSVEDQKRADERIPILRKCPAQVRWLSCEPLLERVELDLEGIDWVIAGGESGPLARPCALEWVEHVVDQCRAQDAACFVKQLGSVVVSEERAADSVGEARKLCGDEKNDRWLWYAGLGDRKGGNMAEWPEQLRVRMYPGDEFPPPIEVPTNEECPF